MDTRNSSLSEARRKARIRNWWLGGIAGVISISIFSNHLSEALPNPFTQVLEWMKKPRTETKPEAPRVETKNPVKESIPIESSQPPPTAGRSRVTKPTLSVLLPNRDSAEGATISNYELRSSEIGSLITFSLVFYNPTNKDTGLLHGVVLSDEIPFDGDGVEASEYDYKWQQALRFNEYDFKKGVPGGTEKKVSLRLSIKKYALIAPGDRRIHLKLWTSDRSVLFEGQMFLRFR